MNRIMRVRDAKVGALVRYKVGAVLVREFSPSAFLVLPDNGHDIISALKPRGRDWVQYEIVVLCDTHEIGSRVTIWVDGIVVKRDMYNVLGEDDASSDEITVYIGWKQFETVDQYALDEGIVELYTHDWVHERRERDVWEV